MILTSTAIMAASPHRTANVKRNVRLAASTSVMSLSVTSKSFPLNRGLSFFDLPEGGLGLNQIFKTVGKIDIYLVGQSPQLVRYGGQDHQIMVLFPVKSCCQGLILIPVKLWRCTMLLFQGFSNAEIILFEMNPDQQRGQGVLGKQSVTRHGDQKKC